MAWYHDRTEQLAGNKPKPKKERKHKLHCEFRFTRNLDQLSIGELQRRKEAPKDYGVPADQANAFKRAIDKQLRAHDRALTQSKVHQFRFSGKVLEIIPNHRKFLS